MKDVILRIFATNGTLVTCFLAVAILLTGITLVDNPSQWWVIPVGLGSILVILLLLLNARVVVKATGAFATALLLSAWGFQIGALTAGDLSGGSSWLFSTLLGFTLCLALSYLRPSAAGRWVRSTLAVLGGFLLTYAFSTLMVMALAAPLGALGTLLIFTVVYYGSRRARFSKKNFPSATLSRETEEALGETLRPLGWGVVPLERRGSRGLLLWNDERAFVVTEVSLAQKFGFAGTAKRPYLSYRGANLNPWLTSLLRDLLPWNVKGAPVMLVLLDVKNSNGKEAKTIGVQLPDTTAVTPVGLLPVYEDFKRGRHEALGRRLLQEWNAFGKPLKPKHLTALDLRLPPTGEVKPRKRLPRLSRFKDSP